MYYQNSVKCKIEGFWAPVNYCDQNSVYLYMFFGQVSDPGQFVEVIYCQRLRSSLLRAQVGMIFIMIILLLLIYIPFCRLLRCILRFFVLRALFQPFWVAFLLLLKNFCRYANVKLYARCCLATLLHCIAVYAWRRQEYSLGILC